MPRARVSPGSAAPPAPAGGASVVDPLSLYNQKRRFDVTPEPPGELAPRTAGALSFVIQKHAASRLHYDFRLELDGYLKSWSVPKGPSLDPAQKRLAMETENHPLGYGGFEGIIPAGEYGGGTVLVWDHGTWEPVEDAASSLAAGHLKFDLQGHKLRGRYALVRLKGRNPQGEDGRAWLLVKDRDAFARPESLGLITEEEPYSVLSGRDLAEVAEAKERVWHSNRGRPDVAGLRGAAEQAMPEEAPPWTAERFSKGRSAPAGDTWLHERLVVGRQVVICLDNGRVRFLDRPRRGAAPPQRHARGLSTWWSDRLGEVLAALPVREAWWEGVVTALKTEGRTEPLPARATELGDAKLTLFLTDAAHVDGVTLVSVPYETRKDMLGKWLAELDEDAAHAVRLVDHVVGRGADVLAAAKKLGFEGLVSKRRDSSRGDDAAVRVLFLNT